MWQEVTKVSRVDSTAEIRVLIRSIVDEVLREVKSDIDMLNRKVTELENDVNSLKGYVGTLYTKSVNTTVATAVREAIDYATRVAEQGVSKVVADEVERRMGAYVTRLERMAIELQTSLSGQAESIKTLVSTLDHLVQRLQQQRSQESIESVVKAVERLANLVGGYGAQIEKMTAALAEVQNSLRSIEMRLRDANRAVSELYEAVLGGERGARGGESV